MSLLCRALYAKYTAQVRTLEAARAQWEEQARQGRATEGALREELAALRSDVKSVRAEAAAKVVAEVCTPPYMYSDSVLANGIVFPCIQAPAGPR